ncbi:TorF family putative porin [Aliikangiella coralliicola]|nr:TorF family putative porin [Aliikangiella coralliicola]
MKYKSITFTPLLLSSVVSPCVMAGDNEFGASATIVSQYLFRGFDLSDEDPAVQGDISLDHSSGLWFSLWASTYDVVTDDGVEIDIAGGYSHEISDNVSVSVGFTEYTYTGDTDSTTEFNIGASFHDFSITYYSDQDLDADYIELGYEIAINNKSSLTLHAGRLDFDAGGDNNDYSITYAYDLTDNAQFFVAYSSNDLDIPGAEDYFIGGFTFTF